MKLALICLSTLICLVQSWSDYHNSNCAGNRATIVHLFEWKWTDIANECERFLGPRGFCGVQTSPANEHAVITTDAMRPWWERYQPVSYKLHSRSGTEAEFQNMVERCNKVGVRIYVDAILNHMAGMGREGFGSAGSSFKSEDGSFPGVPYTMTDFNGCAKCPACCCINSWTDLDAVRNCRLSGLIDMKQSSSYVREKQAEFLNKLIDIGVAGFRIDAAKHMWPNDLNGLWSKLHNLNTNWFPSNSKPFMFLEVIDQDQNGEVRAQEYIHLGRVSEFRYCIKIKNAIHALWEVNNMWDAGWGMLRPEDAFVFVDNHDNQRGHGGGGDPLYFGSPKNYKKAQAITLANDYGYPRMMSSYYFNTDKDGPPHNDDYSTKDVTINEDGSCGNGWVCEHRWTALAGMAGFAKAVSGEGRRNWWQSGNQIAFSRGNKGFFAITNHGTMYETLQTGLPAGAYCNVVQGCPTSSGCTGDVIDVGYDGNAFIKITNPEEPFLAIHVEAKSGSGGCNNGDWTPGPTSPTTSGTTREPGTGNWQHTVLFIQAVTNPGNDLFFTGGIGHEKRPGCTNDADSSLCAISIEHNHLGSTPHYDKFNAWLKGDTKLDWYGNQRGQGTYNGHTAAGTPAVWTTNDQSSPGFQPLNRWGANYWMVDFDMNCDETESGWFEVKGYVTGWEWEEDIFQNGVCSGTIGGSAPYSSMNHMAKCGSVNMFNWNENTCTVDNLN